MRFWSNCVAIRKVFNFGGIVLMMVVARWSIIATEWLSWISAWSKHTTCSISAPGKKKCKKKEKEIWELFKTNEEFSYNKLLSLLNYKINTSCVHTLETTLRKSKYNFIIHLIILSSILTICTKIINNKNKIVNRFSTACLKKIVLTIYREKMKFIMKVMLIFVCTQKRQ